MVELTDRMEDELVVMADDAEIQRELRKIETEFAGTEADGLEMESGVCP